MFSQSEMDEAIAHAKANPIQSRGRTSISRMAAVIKEDNRGRRYFGQNKYKTHPLMKRFSRSEDKLYLHAEIAVILDLLGSRSFVNGLMGWNHPNIDLSKADIYVARVLKDGSPALAKPCDTCLGALTYYGIRKIYYTTLNGYGEI